MTQQPLTLAHKNHFGNAMKIALTMPRRRNKRKAVREWAGEMRKGIEELDGKK